MKKILFLTWRLCWWWRLCWLIRLCNSHSKCTRCMVVVSISSCGCNRGDTNRKWSTWLEPCVWLGCVRDLWCRGWFLTKIVAIGCSGIRVVDKGSFSGRGSDDSEFWLVGWAGDYRWGRIWGTCIWREKAGKKIVSLLTSKSSTWYESKVFPCLSNMGMCMWIWFKGHAIEYWESSLPAQLHVHILAPHYKGLQTVSD